MVPELLGLLPCLDFFAAQAFNISLNVIYPPVSGFEDPYFLFPQRYYGPSSSLKLNI